VNDETGDFEEEWSRRLTEREEDDKSEGNVGMTM
jgi:hypothetical protein